jgi:hypothetical protein
MSNPAAMVFLPKRKFNYRLHWHLVYNQHDLRLPLPLIPSLSKGILSLSMG